jgi:diketogulonate reductase-like aldo/keto reductase
MIAVARSYQVAVVGYSTLRGWPLSLAAIEDPPVEAIAERIGRSPSQVLLRWCLQSGVTVIPRSKSKQHIAEVDMCHCCMYNVCRSVYIFVLVIIIIIIIIIVVFYFSLVLSHQNADLLSFELSHNDMRTINSLEHMVTSPLSKPRRPTSDHFGVQFL